MNESPGSTGQQQRLQHAAGHGTVQPVMRWKTGIHPDRIAETFTTDEARRYAQLPAEETPHVGN